MCAGCSRLLLFAVCLSLAVCWRCSSVVVVWPVHIKPPLKCALRQAAWQILHDQTGASFANFTWGGLKSTSSGKKIGVWRSLRLSAGESCTPA